MKYIMGRRNWTSVIWDDESGDLVFDIRVEIEKGNGVTKGCGSSAHRGFVLRVDATELQVSHSSACATVVAITNWWNVAQAMFHIPLLFLYPLLENYICLRGSLYFCAGMFCLTFEFGPAPAVRAVCVNILGENEAIMQALSGVTKCTVNTILLLLSHPGYRTQSDY